MTPEPFYFDPEFWVAASFALFIVLAFRPLLRALNRSLDARSAEIAAELAEARRLREEAQETLEAYKKKQEESLKEAEAIVKNAQDEAGEMAKKAEQELRQSLDKRKKAAMDKIAQAEHSALQEVQEHIVDIAVSVARTIIADHLSRTGNAEIVRHAAHELERKLH